MLYCICRRPYDRRAMIACDKCDEWYHFDCVKISSAPKIYICPACNPGPRGDMQASVLTAQDRYEVVNDDVFYYESFSYIYEKVARKCGWTCICLVKGD